MKRKYYFEEKGSYDSGVIVRGVYKYFDGVERNISIVNNKLFKVMEDEYIKVKDLFHEQTDITIKFGNGSKQAKKVDASYLKVKNQFMDKYGDFYHNFVQENKACAGKQKTISFNFHIVSNHRKSLSLLAQFSYEVQDFYYRDKLALPYGFLTGRRKAFDTVTKALLFVEKEIKQRKSKSKYDAILIYYNKNYSKLKKEYDGIPLFKNLDPESVKARIKQALHQAKYVNE